MKNAIINIGGIVMVSLFLFHCKTPSAVSVLGPTPFPEDNETTEAKIALGRKLFFDTRLSYNNTVSCGTCHLPERAFTDGLAVSNGVDGKVTMRNSPSILNAGYLETVMFDAHIETLEKQVIVPIQEHTEMNMQIPVLIEKLKAIPEYQNAAQEIFQRDFDPWVLTRSISAFERSLISDNSRFDQYYYHGEKDALTEQEKRGWKLFSKELYCTECHPAPYFTTFKAANNGLYKEFGEDKGRFRIHLDSMDIGKFKVPSLRNIELTGPYMHDGSKESIDAVIDHYTKGGEGHYLQDERIKPFEISNKDKAALKSFLVSLTDTSYMKDFRD